MSIPKIFHQMWKDRNIPSRFSKYVASWRFYLPEFVHMFWTDSDIYEFIERYHPRFLALYKCAPHPAIRFDLARYLILKSYGGVYADIDFECYREPGSLFENACLVLGWEWSGAEDAGATGERELDIRAMKDFFELPRENRNTLGNSFIASSKGHEFIDCCLEKVAASVNSSSKSVEARAVWGISGPLAITEVFLDNFNAHWNAKVLPNSCIFPIDWHPPTSNFDCGTSLFPDAFAAHHWAGTWWQNQPKDDSVISLSKISATPELYVS